MSRAQENYFNKRQHQLQQTSYALTSSAPLPPPQAGVDISQSDQGQEETISNVLPIYGSSSTFNINTLLFNNIMEADYFKALYQLRSYHEIVGEFV